jgi:hypothetical protein
MLPLCLALTIRRLAKAQLTTRLGIYGRFRPI